MSGRIGISIGDVSGIGPEVTLKAIAADPTASDPGYVLIGNELLLQSLNKRFSLGLPFGRWKKDAPAETTPFLIFDPDPNLLASKSLEKGGPTVARAALAYLSEAARVCLEGHLGGLVTAPVNKEAIIRLGQRFIGQTEFLSQLSAAPRTAMMLLGQDDRGRWLRVALVTTHLPLRAVPDAIAPQKIAMVIELAAQACRDLGLGRAKVAVCGLNPHAGEGGAVGDEEGRIIAPAVRDMQARGVDVSGPYSADTLFYQAFRGDYDAVVAMYHDQGLVPLKMIGFETGINWTLGLPFVRTSPDHGTAYDIAEKGSADPRSMEAAIQLAKKLVRSRAQPCAQLRT